MTSDNLADAVLNTNPHTRARRRTETIAKGVLLGASAVSVVILAYLILRLTFDGFRALSFDFFTNFYWPLSLSKITGQPIGILDSIIATVIVVVVTMTFAVPLGVGGAIWLTEYAKDNWFKRFIENWIANLAGVPSVVYGLLGLALFVRIMQMGASYLAAGLTMALLILPIIVVASQEALKAVPGSLREASYGLGATRWQTIRSHVLPNAIPGILTGNILALSRAAGETAPILVIGMPVFQTGAGFGLSDTGTPLQLRIFDLANEAEHELVLLAWGAVIVLVVATLLLNLAAILLRNRFSRRTRW